MPKLTEKGHIYALFAIVVLATALGALTQPVMNAMMGGVVATFAVGPEVGQWLTTIYMLGMGITVPVVTYLSQKFTTKQLTYGALAIFLVGSFVAMVAPSFWVLFLGRILQAIASGITLPLLQAIAVTQFPPHQHATAMGIAGIAMGFAPNIGPLIGGAMVDSLGWRSFFVLLSVLLALLIVATFALVPSKPRPALPAALDVWSFLLSTFGFGGLLLGLTEAASLSLSHPLVWAPLIVGILCLIAFIRRQRRVSDPLINLDIFQSRRYNVSFWILNGLFASFMGITLIIPLWVAQVGGGSALEAGMVFIPATIFALILNPVSGILADRFGTRIVVIGGTLCLAVGALSMAFVNETTPLWLLTLMQTVRGFGVSSLIGPLSSWGLSDLPRPLVMDGSAFCATVRQACASFGTAAMMYLVSLSASAAFGAEICFQWAFGLSALLSIAVLGASVILVRKN